MAQRYYVKLSPLQTSTVLAKVKPLEGDSKIYVTFVPNQVYEVDQGGLNDLKDSHKLNLFGNSNEAQTGKEMGLKYIETIPCVSCAKRRNIDPKGLTRYEFEMFVETDQNGNILESEYV